MITKYFIGSASDTHLGVGNLFIGFEVRKTEEGYQMVIDPFETINIYDFMVVENGNVRSPEDSDLSK